MKFEFSWQIFKKYMTVKFHKKSVYLELSSVWTDGQTDMMKLLLVFCNSANTPKNCRVT